VNWRNRIAIVMLLVLAASPLAGTICAMTCLSASKAVAAHHRDGQECEGSTSSRSSDATIGAFSASHCGNHEGAVPQVAATAAQRADDLAVMSAPATSDPIDPLFGSVSTFDPVFQYTPPPGTAPPTTTPLVLRV
jgi:hypothetical protein